jgi:predicted Zn-dependent peptidase
VELVKQVIQCFIDTGPSQDELELAVNQLGGGLLRSFSDNKTLAKELADLALEAVATDHPAAYLQQLAQLTPAACKPRPGACWLSSAAYPSSARAPQKALQP